MLMKATGTGRTIEEAMAAAKAQLNLKDGDDFEIIESKPPVKKTLGLFGGSPAMVTLFVSKEDEPVVEVKKAERPKPQKTETVEQTETVKTTETTAQAETEKLPEVSADSEEYTLVKPTLDYLKNILEKMGVSELEVKAYKTDDGYEIAFDGKGLGVAIGRKGDTLDALQHLASLIANREHNDYVRITLNPGGYREKRRNTLVELAVRTAKKAKEKERNYSLEPMNAYERRIIHNAVQTVEGVLSWSIGENDNRRVVIGTSKENRTYRSNSSDRNRGGRNNRRGNGGRGDRREKYSQTPTREPRKDTADLPLYGIIK